MRYLVLLVIWLLPQFSFAQDWEDRQVFEGASSTQELRIISSTDTSFFAPIIQNFVAERPDISVEYLVTGTADIDDIFRAAPDQYDVVISSAMDLQLKLANDGLAMPLRLVEGCTSIDGDFVPAPSTEPVQVISPSAANSTVNIMETIVSQGNLKSILTIPGYRVAAKTGTAEIADSSGYGSERVISLAGMAPAEDPEYVVLVSFYKPQTSRVSTAAAPAFHDMMSHVLKH